MMDIDLSDVTVVVSVKPESAARLTNLARICEFYRTFGVDAEILVVEQGAEQRIAPDPENNLRVHFIRDPGLHWKTRNMNLGAALSSRPLLLMSDCDTIPHPKALAEARATLAHGEEFVILYNGIVVNLSETFSATSADWPEFIAKLKYFPVSEVAPGAPPADADMVPLYGNTNYRAVGGGFLCHREAFFSIGGWNPNFVSYGGEDQELYDRARILGHPFRHLEDHNLYHFAHPRGMESRYGAFYRQNMQELERVGAMVGEELAAYAARGFRSMPFEDGYDYARFCNNDADGWHRVPDARTDLSDLTILVVADPKVVAREASCLEPLSDHLEEHYRGYDLRICESRTTAYKYQVNRKNIAYFNAQQGTSQEELRTLAVETNRPCVMLMQLSADAETQFRMAKVRLAKVRHGLPVKDVFPAVSAAWADA